MQALPIRIFLVLFILVLIYPSSVIAATERRIALVIGNSSYTVGPLKNPLNDALDMALTLQKLGFTVVLKKNADLQTMEEAIEDFGNKLKRGGVGLFYYAGHGLQMNGINYLMPIGVNINKESDVRYKAVDAGRILDEMANANNGLNVVILDACRDNPFVRNFRSFNRGLAIINTASTGTFIAYSTGPGQVAGDGEGRNSPFTTALLESIQTPDLPIELVFKSVRQKLDASTGGKQIPWELSSLKGDFYFNPSTKLPPTKITTSSEPYPILKQAQDAYEKGCFADPESSNAIELARQVLRDYPNDLGAKDLITRAASAYENQGKLALAKGDKNAALRIYQRLFKLFPEQEAYLKETLALEKPALPDIAGTWHWAVRTIFVPDRINIIKYDGTCNLSDGLSCTWSFQKDGKNIIIFYFSDKWTHTMTLSKDGLSMTGSDDWGTKVTARKIKGP
jgi:hypothetical protein